MNSFVGSFDEEDLPAANREIEELIVVANFSPSEKYKFISGVQKHLAAQNISLDFIESLGVDFC